METRKFADATLRDLNFPDLEALIRNAPPRKQRAFALACARHAASVTGMQDSIVAEALSRAARLVEEDSDPCEEHAVRACEAAWQLQRRLDDRQLTISEEIEADTGGRPGAFEEHPRASEFEAAYNHWCTARAAAYALHEDPLEAAAACADELLKGLKTGAVVVWKIGLDTLR